MKEGTKMKKPKIVKTFAMPITDKIPEKGKEPTITDYHLFKGKPTIPQILKQIPKGKTAMFKEIQLPTLTCQRCEHTWQNRTQNPKRCPQCKSPYWNKPRRKPKP
jgi:predicted Zn-ribbon and HTH transcriptional regulator